MYNIAIMKAQQQIKKIETWMWGVPILIAITISLYAVLQSRPGIMGVGIFYLGPSFVALLAIIFLIWGIISSFRNRPFFNRFRIIGFVFLLALCFTDFLYQVYPSSYDDKPSKTNFRLPLDEEITVGWGGAEEKTNYHVVAPDQRWAYDLLEMKEGKTYRGDSSKLQNYYCYGLTVVSPAKGKVVSVFDTDPDMPIGTLGGGTDPGGNQIVLQVAPKEFLFICHLQAKSIKVKVGDSVEQGQALALVGNSGNTSEPHIHIHLQSTRKPSFGEGIPMPFSNYKLNNKIIERGIPLGGFTEQGEFCGQVVQHFRQ